MIGTIAVSSCKIAKAVMCETGAVRRGVVNRRRKAGRRASRRAMRDCDAWVEAKRMGGQAVCWKAKERKPCCLKAGKDRDNMAVLLAFSVVVV